MALRSYLGANEIFLLLEEGALSNRPELLSPKNYLNNNNHDS